MKGNQSGGPRKGIKHLLTELGTRVTREWQLRGVVSSARTESLGTTRTENQRSQTGIKDIGRLAVGEGEEQGIISECQATGNSKGSPCHGDGGP